MTLGHYTHTYNTKAEVVKPLMIHGQHVNQLCLLCAELPITQSVPHPSTISISRCLTSITEVVMGIRRATAAKRDQYYVIETK